MYLRGLLSSKGTKGKGERRGGRVAASNWDSWSSGGGGEGKKEKEVSQG